MKIIKKRVLNVESYISTVRDGEEFHIAFNGFNENIARIQQIGFSNNPQVGEQVLPTVVGPVTRFNANGSFTLRRDLPKETYFMTRLWK